MDLPLGLWTIIFAALAFDFINGFHDAANSIATVVSTRVLSPRLAVLWAAFFNFIAFLVFKTHVAQTIGKGVVDPSVITPAIIFAGVIGAILWNLLTWWLGLPTSSSHALVGGFVGAAVAAVGPKSILLPGLIKIAQFIVLSPLIGMALGFFFMWAVTWIFWRSTPGTVDRLFRRLQLVSAAAFSLGHGGNDAQKTMGVITALLYSTGKLTGEFHVPLWVVLSSHAAMGLGTMSGGWRIVKTMGMKLTKLQRHPGLDHPHDHRRDRRRRIDAAAVGGEMGRRGPHRMGVGPHHAGGGGAGRADVVGGEADGEGVALFVRKQLTVILA
jgi:PiT family inorganic phosphate transporter